MQQREVMRDGRHAPSPAPMAVLCTKIYGHLVRWVIYWGDGKQTVRQISPAPEEPVVREAAVHWTFSTLALYGLSHRPLKQSRASALLGDACVRWARACGDGPAASLRECGTHARETRPSSLPPQA